MKYDLNYWSFTLDFAESPYTGLIASGFLTWVPPQSHNIVIREVAVSAFCTYETPNGTLLVSVDGQAALYSDATQTRPICTIARNVTDSGAPFQVQGNGISHSFDTKNIWKGEIIMPLNGEMYWTMVWAEDSQIRTTYTIAQIISADFIAFFRIGYTMREKI